MKDFTHQSIVRNGNHFIRFQGAYHFFYKNRWMLIDGPWFHYLEKYVMDEVHLVPYQRMSTIPIDECDYAGIDCRRDPTVWVRYDRAILGIEKTLIKGLQSFEYMTALTDHYESFTKSLGNIWFHPVKSRLSFYTRLIWWECDGGILPAWIKNPIWDEDLEELFTFTTYHIDEEFR